MNRPRIDAMRRQEEEIRALVRGETRDLLLCERIEIEEHRPILAFQLDLFGRPPKPARAWRPAWLGFRLGGVPIPPTDDEMRQMLLCRADTITWRYVR